MSVNAISTTKQLTDATLRRTNPYNRIDSFFTQRLHLKTLQYSATQLPDDFMKPSAPWQPSPAINIVQKAIPRNIQLSNAIQTALYTNTARHLATKHHATAISIRVYRPANTTTSSWLLWLHGGGFTEGSLDSPEAHAFCAELSARHNFTCVSVDYTLATPYAPSYPYALDDVIQAWHWMVQQVSATNLDKQSTTLCIGGASAGATLAASATQCMLAMHTKNSSFTLPQAFFGAYGVYHTMQQQLIPDNWEFNTSILPEPLRFTAQSCGQMFERYTGAPYFFPKYSIPAQESLHNFPPSALLCSEFDDLAPSSIAFAKQLQTAQHPTSLAMAPGVLHGYFNWYPSSVLPQTYAGIDFYARFIDYIRLRTRPTHCAEGGTLHS